MYQRPTRFNILPDVVKNLLIINGIFYLATVVLRNTYGLDLVNIFGLHLPGSSAFRPYQIITHLFLHGDQGHIFSNMFSLWMFGSLLENVWGAKKFLIFYLLTGFGAALLTFGVDLVHVSILRSELASIGYSSMDLTQLVKTGSYNQLPGVDLNSIGAYFRLFNKVSIGASGAVYGILMGAALTFPNIVLWPFPIKLKYYVLILGTFEFISSVSMNSDQIGHVAHLGGMLFGYILIKNWNKNRYRQN